MKNLFKKLVGVAAALAIVATLVGPSVTAQAAIVNGYDWDYTTDGGVTWSEVPADMRPAIFKLDYDGTDFTITSAGRVNIRGVYGQITTIQKMTSTAQVYGDNLLDGNVAIVDNVTVPIYVYFEIALESGSHTTVYSRFSNLTY